MDELEPTNIIDPGGIAAEDIKAGEFVTFKFSARGGDPLVYRYRPNATTATHTNKPRWKAPDPFDSGNCLRVERGHRVGPAADTGDSPFGDGSVYSYKFRSFFIRPNYIVDFNSNVPHIQPKYDREHAVHPFAD